MTPMSNRVSTVVGASLLLVSVAASGLMTAADVALIEAVRAGDHAGARALIEQGASVNATQGDGATALHWGGAPRRCLSRPVAARGGCERGGGR